MKIDKTAKENTIKKIDQKFSSRIKKPDIIGYEIVDNSTLTGVKYMRESKEQHPPKWFSEFLEIYKRDISLINSKIDAIMECPTIKGELKFKE